MINDPSKQLKLILLFCIIFIQQLTFGQTSLQLESLRAQLSEQSITLKDSLEIQVNIASHFINKEKNIDSATYYINKVLVTPMLSNILSKGYYKHLIVKAWTHHGNSEMDSAKHYYLKVQGITNKNGDRKSQIETFINIGAFLEQTRDTQAMFFVDNFLSVIDTSKTRDDKIASDSAIKKIKK